MDTSSKFKASLKNYLILEFEKGYPIPETKQFAWGPASWQVRTVSFRVTRHPRNPPIEDEMTWKICQTPRHFQVVFLVLNEFMILTVKIAKCLWRLHPSIHPLFVEENIVLWDMNPWPSAALNKNVLQDLIGNVLWHISPKRKTFPVWEAYSCIEIYYNKGGVLFFSSMFGSPGCFSWGAGYTFWVQFDVFYIPCCEREFVAPVHSNLSLFWRIIVINTR